MLKFRITLSLTENPFAAIIHSAKIDGVPSTMGE